MKCACKFVSSLLATLLIIGWIAVPTAAQDYPNKPITLICPFPPGGATDAISRIVQDAMGQSLGQQLVIENIGGAGGMIAAAKAARAAPDGYTIMIHQVALAAGMSMYKNLSFEAEKDFIPIGLINTAASTWAARPNLPPTTFEEMVSWMKAPGSNVKVAHAGVGSFGHLAGVLVAQELGATVTQVPYRGAGPALNDLLAGEVDLSSQSAVQAGPLRDVEHGLERFRGFWAQPLDALGTELARGKRSARTRKRVGTPSATLARAIMTA